MTVIARTLVGAAALALATSAFAGGDQASEKNKSNVSNATRSEDSGFAKLDKDRDGYISKTEAAADKKLSQDFGKFDLNHDGKLNRAEYLAARGKEDANTATNKVTGKDRAASGSSSSTTK
jgi:Ca2+-binding EF-hand superfamily protein